ncbi:MAG: PAS domain-containing protein [Halobaculum sp.]
MDRASESGSGVDASRVHLLLSPGRNRQLLAEWLGELPQYDVTTSDPRSPVPAEYDLLLVDETALDTCGDDLRQNRRAVDPVYLPHLLVTRVDAARDAAERDLIDDVVEIPVEQATLQRRIENLLRARHASLRLARVREQYEELVELTPESILLVREGQVVYGNAAATDLFGFGDREELVGRPTTDFVTEADAGTLADVIETVEAEGRLGEFREVTLQTLDGEEIPTEIAGVTVTYDDEPVTQLVVRDLSEKRERQQRLDLLGRAIEAAAQGVTIADARREDEPLIYANTAFERITGYDTDEILGQNCRFLQGERTDEETVAEIRQAIEDRRPSRSNC